MHTRGVALTALGLMMFWMLALVAGASHAQPIDKAIRDAGLTGGIIVHLPATDGVTEAQLAESGRFIVQGLATQEAGIQTARAAITAKGLYGLATVAHWRTSPRLPYADNTVNLLVVDLDRLKAQVPARVPSLEDMLRVIVPEGVLLVRSDGKWEQTVKPRPDAMGSWGHHDYGPEGNPVSPDTLVAPMRQQQWLTARQTPPWEGNPAGYDAGAGIRIWQRYAVMDLREDHIQPQPRGGRWVLQCRDAFNGTVLWSIDRDSRVAGSRNAYRQMLTLADGKAYTWLKADGPMVAIDLGSGKVTREFDQLTFEPTHFRDEQVTIRADREQVLVGIGSQLVSVDPDTGKTNWTFSHESRQVLAPIMDAPRSRAYAILAEAGDRAFHGRWPVTRRATSVVAVDLRTGKLDWECTDVASREIGKDKAGKTIIRNIGQLLVGEEQLFIFGSAAISGGHTPYLGAIDLKTGRLVYSNDKPFQRDYNVASYNMLYRDGQVFFAGAFTNVWRFDPDKQAVERVLNHGFNQRCTRFTATSEYFLFGMSAFYDKQFAGEQVSVGRSGCALGNVPANGLTYFTPTACGCVTQKRGFQALTSEPMPRAIDDDARLSSVSIPPVRIDTADRPIDGPVAEDWMRQWRAAQAETPPVTFNDLQLVAVVHRHRLEARQGDKVVWRFIAGGRISSPPVVTDGLALFGAHDGCVYAVDAATGTLQWKYLLAPTLRYIGVNGQLENTWPIYGVTRMDADILASAGTHVELAGGVTAAALNPRTGKLTWIKRLQKDIAVIPPGGKGAKIVAHSFINSVPVHEDGNVILGDGGRKGGRFCSVEILSRRRRMGLEHEVEGDLAEEAFALLGGG